MRILFFSHTSESGGAERSMLELIKELQVYGAKIKVVLPGHGNLEKYLENMNVQYDVIDYFMWVRITRDIEINLSEYEHTYYEINKYCKYIMHWRPDFIYTNTLAIPWGAIVSKILNIPHFWHIREFGTKDHHLIFDIGYFNSLKFIEKYSDVIIVNSEPVQKHLKRFINKDIFVARNYVTIAKTSLKENILPENFWIQDSVKMLCCASIHPGKCQVDIVKALHILLNKKFKISLCLMGKITEPKYFKKINRYIKKYSLEKFINYCGFLENPYPVMTKSDFVVNASRCEAFGRVTVEAMLLKKPVIGADTGFTSNIVRDDFNGYVFRQGNAESLSNSIIKLIRNGKMKTLGKNGFGFIRNYISKEAYSGVVWKLLKSNKGVKSDSLSEDPWRYILKELRRRI